MAKFLLSIYKILSIIFLPIVIIIVIFRVLQGKEINSRIKERFAFSSIKKPLRKGLGTLADWSPSPSDDKNNSQCY